MRRIDVGKITLSKLKGKALKRALARALDAPLKDKNV